MKNRRRLALLFAVLLILSLLAGCGQKRPMDSSGSVMKPGSDNLQGEGSSGGDSMPTYQKLIRNLSLNAETEDLDTLLKAVEERVKELGGYVEKKEVNMGSAYASRFYRNASLTLRIPAEKADSFVDRVEEAANVVSATEDVEDVTLEYVATESRIAALETEQTRLLELLAKAANMSDLLQIEARLTQVRGELEEVKSRLKLYDNLVAYATIKLSIQEVREYTKPEEEQTFFQRIGSGLVENLKDVWNFLVELMVFLITGLPYWILIGGGLAAVFFVSKKRKAKKKKAANEKPQG